MIAQQFAYADTSQTTLPHRHRLTDPGSGANGRRPHNHKKREVLSNFSFCTRSRGRTGTGVNLLVFETSASTDSAIRAGDLITKSGDKDIKILINQQVCQKKSTLLLRNRAFYASKRPTAKF